jgi:hypothetical protein
VHEHLSAGNVAQKLYAQALPFVCTLYHTRNIGKHVAKHHAQVRVEGSEGIVCDFWFHVRDRLDNRRFSSIRESYESDVSHQFEFKFNITHFSGIAEFCEVRSLSCRRREVCISKSSPSSSAKQELLSFECEIDDFLAIFGISDDGSYGDFEYGVSSSSTVHFLSRSAFPIFCLNIFCVSIADKSRFMDGSLEDDISSISTVTSIWPSIWDIFFTTP